MDLRIGVVGLGLRKTLAVEAHRPGKGAQIVAACDTDPTALDWARSAFGTEVMTTSSFDALLATPLDAVMVLTPDDTHIKLGLQALTAGLPTLIEKPLAITPNDCDALLSAAHRHGARLYVGHNMRHMPVIKTMRSLIREGAIGTVEAIWCRHFVGHGGDFYFKDWHAQRAHSYGLLLQKGAHDIDVIHWLAGATTQAVSAVGKLSVYNQVASRQAAAGQREPDWFNPKRNWPPLSQTGLHPTIDVEDLSMMLMQLRNGVQASYQQCHYTPDYWRNYTVIGTAGRLENFGDTNGASVRVWNRKRSGYDDTGDSTIAVPLNTGDHGGADTALIDEFLDFVVNGGKTDTSPVAARDAVAAAVAATDSLRDGGTLRTVPSLDPELASYFAHGQR